MAFFALFGVYACIVIPLGVHKGGDIVAEIGQGKLLLHGDMVNVVPPGQGSWWPPAALLLVGPFALIAGTSLTLAKALWSGLGIAALAWSVHESGRRWGWRPALLALAVILFPVHNNFHHLNIESILLALLVAAAVDLSGARTGRAGVWVGLATAFKVFPGLVLVYFAVRRQWKALAAGVATTCGVTMVALLPYGPHGAVQALANWARIGTHGATYRGGAIVGFHMQKLGILGYNIGGAPWSIVLLHLLALGLVAAILLNRSPEDDSAAPVELGAVVLLAVLLTPIAWLHTFTLGYLAWVAVFASAAAATLRPGWRLALGIAAVYASTALSAVPWPAFTRFANFNSDTVGGIITLCVLLVQRHARRLAAPARARLSGGPSAGSGRGAGLTA